uniref:Uncharacterized protein n=1 Tax=Grammatophora oceanica TaxID=210454 RepID=A0A7S1UNY5_9STRA|mmetsp:Transcript_1433/g.1973  ORF Transcript_1433/g.1973 Transcript_1433/m.1973 type:complete len:445 (+) Transcript_1433:72-1406(+)
MCASSIIRLHKLLVQDKVYKPDRGGNKPETVLPTHVQKLMKMYQKCVVKSKEIREKKLDGALKPGCTLEDFDKEVEDKFVESFKKKSIVSLREMVDRRKREVQVIEDCTALLAGLQERPGEEGVEDADRGGGGRTRQKGERVRPTSTTSTDSHFSKNRRKKRLPSGKSRGAAKLPKSSTASPRRAGKRLKRSFDEEEEQQEGNHQPPVMPSSARGMLHRAPPPAPPPPPSVPLVHHQHDRVPSVLYDPALAPSSWTPQPQQYFYHPAPPVSSRGPPPPPAPAPARDTYPSYHVDQGGAHDHPSPASSSYAAAYRSYDDNEGSTGRANPPSRAFHNAYTAPAPPSSQTFYRSYAPIMPSFQQKSVASRVLDYALLELAGARADVVRYEQLRLAVATLTSGDPVVNQVLDDLYRNGVVSLEQLVQFTLSFGTREGNIVPRTARATF